MSPGLLRIIKDIPIPTQVLQTEYINNEIKFVLENLDISSLSLLPGHVDITAPAGSQSTTTAIGTLTHIRMQAVQLALKEDFTGLMEFSLPPKGIDIDIEHIEANVAEDIDMQVKQFNHPILASIFRPVIMLRFREAISRTLEEQIRGLFDTADALALDIGRRLEAFKDAGLGTASSVVAAMWSEIDMEAPSDGGWLTVWLESNWNGSCQG
ncbi:hypothetical protein BDR05DRAFT_1005978 [Suillus weaverae]|nr:hypothetical protein BDR05DRAFT_1005978 [Suillus weaverae]